MGGSGLPLLFVLLLAGMAQGKGGPMDPKTLLKGSTFFVCKVNCGPMKAQILRANIHSNGGLVFNDLEENPSIFLFDKSCEVNTDKMKEVRSSFANAKPDTQLVSSKWLEEVLACKEWKDPPVANQTDSPGGSPSNKRTIEACSESAGAKNADDAASGKRVRGNDHEDKDSSTNNRAQEASGDFRGALQRIVAHPDKHADVVLMRTQLAVVIYDAFPKAAFHLLVLPTVDILSVSKLTRDHLPILRELHRVGLHVIASIRAQQPEGKTSERFRMGYHSVPSLNHLHLHVISTDFNSPCLKNKKHWNSFQPPFFADSLHVQGKVESEGAFAVDAPQAEALLKEPLRCHRTCAQELKSIPLLKDHIRACRLPVAAGGLY